MEFKNKHSNYFQLKGVQHLEADQALLQKLDPGAKSLRRLHDPDKMKIQQEILWELLDVSTPDQILSNRSEKSDSVNDSGSDKVKGKNKEKGKDKKKPVTEPDPEPPTETVSAEGEKKEADQGAGVSEDQLDESGGSGHSESDTAV